LFYLFKSKMKNYLHHIPLTGRDKGLLDLMQRKYVYINIDKTK
jgi:hypothetical protein